MTYTNILKKETDNKMSMVNSYLYDQNKHGFTRENAEKSSCSENVHWQHTQNGPSKSCSGEI